MKQLKNFIFFLALMGASIIADMMPSTGTQKSNFGKTHFIVGYQDYESDLDDVPEVKSTEDFSSDPSSDGTICLDKNGKLCMALFAPDHNLRASLRELINHEKEKILIAIYTFTDAHVARELVEAHNRGVKIEVITDPSCLRSQHQKINLLKEAGIPVYVYDSGLSKGASSIMHNKFALFSKTIHGKKLVWTGSFNFTKSGSDVNQENVLILDDPKIVRQYADQFDKLKSRTEKSRETIKTVVNNKSSITTIPS